ncbi:NAD-dependent succinate-semialdehyde dehydrogenase [Robiginitalea marina]|uniref:NAD-dependent succinate-semialdehyde dehydrogenase n=1 Tax=Robiginitalea marina TaxID=2954105 RepID=A0ABT1AVB9_9FLAO|nr:NAD-dependent succinate-semialdehyde dehydrogenase [Robiginitalea marina]MCO5723552.1 NAD-dependent succinate-semialdehyde dehydrogenase [Robiginitalea marina]
MSTSINPYTGEALCHFTAITDETLYQKVADSGQAFKAWRLQKTEERAVLLRRVGEKLRSGKHHYARTITVEMGKPITQALAEVEKCAWVCDYYAANAARFLEDRTESTEAARSYVRFEPLGPVLAIMPWNYPFWQVIRFAAPSLSAGNTCLLKHAPNVWQCAGELQQLFEESGYPPGVFQTLYIGEPQVEGVLADPRVRALTLTGSTRAGAAVAALCGKYLKKTVLELGGSNAMIVFPDADLDKAVETCIESRFQNTGQSCIATKRLLLHQSISAEFTDKLLKQVRALKAGDPMDPETYIGVMAREDLAGQLEAQMKNSLDMGAVLACGGKREGTFFEPTILLGVTESMPVFREETFGPLLAVSTFEDEGAALRLAGKSRFGLGVSLFTRDPARVQRMIPLLEEGAVFVNSMVKSDPRLPFGGVKDSGYGRELSVEGIREFVNVKTVYIP